MRTEAWLNATLNPPKPSRNKKSIPSDEPPTSRRQKFKADGIAHVMPDPGPAAYLLGVFFDVGPVRSEGMGPFPLGYSDLQAWQQCMGVRLSPWEVGVLRDLSRAYCGELGAAADPQVAAPGSSAETPKQALQRRERVSKGLGAMLRAASRKPAG